MDEEEQSQRISKVCTRLLTAACCFSPTQPLLYYRQTMTRSIDTAHMCDYAVRCR
jgi:hypothetical protein